LLNGRPSALVDMKNEVVSQEGVWTKEHTDSSLISCYCLDIGLLKKECRGPRIFFDAVRGAGLKKEGKVGLRLRFLDDLGEGKDMPAVMTTGPWSS